MLQRIATHITHRIYEMPVLVLMPHSRCNCRCVMCDIWKANSEKREISTEELAHHLAAFKKLGVKRVALSGGEALMHSNLWKFCEQLGPIGAKISLLSTGLALKANAAEIIAHCDDVIVSLDGGPEVHNQIRNIPNAYEKLADGVKALKTAKPSFRVTGRCVLQKTNFKDFFSIVRSAKELGLNQISFLAADVSSTAFNRPQEWAVEKKEEVGLSANDAEELKLILEKSFVMLAAEYKQRFISESPAKMLEILQHYHAHLGLGEFAKKKCNAPWVSSVVESTGDVLPCFFHKPYGNIYKKSFLEIINSENAIAFRKKLDIQKDPVCQRCVCSVYVEPWQKV